MELRLLELLLELLVLESESESLDELLELSLRFLSFEESCVELHRSLLLDPPLSHAVSNIFFLSVLFCSFGDETFASYNDKHTHDEEKFVANDASALILTKNADELQYFTLL